MRMYLISDNVDTRTGMRLSGVDGCVLHEAEELKVKLAEVLTMSDVGILLLTEKISDDFSNIIADFRAAHRTPLVVSIPDRHGSTKGDHFLSAYTDSAMGISK